MNARRAATSIVLSALTLLAASAHADSSEYALVTAGDDWDTSVWTGPGSLACSLRFPAALEIDGAVDPSHPPAGAKSLVVAYIDPAGATTYKSYAWSGATPDEHTLFAIGSLSKLFTSTLLGVAAVRDPSVLTTSVPVPAGFPNFRPNTTFTDLADHHGGLPKNAARNLDVVNDLWAEYTQGPIQCDPTNPAGQHDCGCCTTAYQTLLGGTVPSACSTNLASVHCPVHAHTTGASGFVYSNEGFSVLGHALANRLGYSTWLAANRDLVVQPLGMNDTVTRETLSPAQEARTANGCSASGPNTQCQLLTWLPVGNPAGGLFSTASDLVKFLSYNMQPLPAPCAGATCELNRALGYVHKTYEASPSGPVQLGWQVKTLSQCGSNVDLVWKDGANGTFRSWMAYIPSQHRGVVLLSSTAALDLATIGRNILTLAQ